MWMVSSCSWGSDLQTSTIICVRSKITVLVMMTTLIFISSWVCSVGNNVTVTSQHYSNILKCVINENYFWQRSAYWYLFIYLGASQKEHLNDRWCFKEMADQDMTSISKKIIFFWMNCSIVSFDSGLPPRLVDWPDAFLLWLGEEGWSSL